MELDFDNDEFESFLKSKADQYRMYPSDKCWKGISFILHSRSRWITIGGSLLLISVFFFFGGQFLNTSSGTASKPPVNEPARISKFSSAVSNTFLPESPESLRASLAVAADLVARNEEIVANPQTLRFNSFSTANGSFFPAPVKAVRVPVFAYEDVETLEAETEFPDAFSMLSARPETSNISLSAEAADAELKRTEASGQLPPTIPTEEASEKSVNWLQEIAAIKLSQPRKNTFNLQFYFSPTVSYRRLVDNAGLKTSSVMNPTFNNASVGSINRFVDHKPSIGVEIGSNVVYSAGRNLLLKTGLQLNYSRYTIKAFKSYTEKAAIALSSVGMRTSDTIVTYTNVRNFNGTSPEMLENQYLQVSMPVGAELILLGAKKKLQFSLAGTVQPTYLIFNDAYLLTSDYQHYAKEPSLVRKWNVHTSAEAFVSYRSGSMKWQVGPQFRYQMMSSYNDRYPIKEYLMEYGVKFGIIKTLK